MDYENRYETALTTYTNLMKDPVFSAKVFVCPPPSQRRNPTIDSLLLLLTSLHQKELDELVEVRVEACLIMPIQRIPRYRVSLVIIRWA